MSKTLFCIIEFKTILNYIFNLSFLIIKKTNITGGELWRRQQSGCLLLPQLLHLLFLQPALLLCLRRLLRVEFNRWLNLV